jgi:hypothetical protein
VYIGDSLMANDFVGACADSREEPRWAN